MANLKLILLVTLSTIGVTFTQLAQDPRVVFLGVIEGKNVFADNITLRNWRGADQYCRTMEMGLFSIDSVAKANFLRSKESVLGGGQYYWTPSIDKMSYGQFMDTRTGLEPEQVLAVVYSAPRNCLAYAAGNGFAYHEVYVSASCDDLYGALCSS